MKLKKIFKNNIFFFILGALVFGIIGVSASTLLYSSDVTYDNSESGLSSTNLQDVLDELYEQAKNAPSCDSNGVCTVTCPNGLNYFATSTGYLCVPESVSVDGKSISIVTSGDGLYADSVESGRYIYRGSRVDNYITFNNETWRIISVERDGTLKIIRNQPLSSKQAWDTGGTRDSSTSTYCTNASDMGCSAWAATANLAGTPSVFTLYFPNGNTSDSINYSGTVTKDASLNACLNGTYYSSLSSTTKIVKGTFNVSTPGDANDTETLEVDAEQEKQYQWKGYVALMNVTELLRASTSNGCTNLSAARNNASTSTCKSNNWLWPTSSIEEWTLSPYVDSGRFRVWYVNSGGFVNIGHAFDSFSIRPVVFLSSDITLSGTGTSTDPYTIN